MLFRLFLCFMIYVLLVLYAEGIAPRALSFGLEGELFLLHRSIASSPLGLHIICKISASRLGTLDIVAPSHYRRPSTIGGRRIHHRSSEPRNVTLHVQRWGPRAYRGILSTVKWTRFVDRGNCTPAPLSPFLADPSFISAPVPHGNPVWAPSLAEPPSQPGPLLWRDLPCDGIVLAPWRFLNGPWLFFFFSFFPQIRG